MSPCCGGKTIRRRPPKTPAVEGTDRVLVEYVGDRAELFSVRGPATKIRYYFSSQDHERVLPVYVEDVPGLEAMGDWRQVEEEAG